MTASLLKLPFDINPERYVSRATLTAPHELDAPTKAKLTKTNVPILELNIDAKIHQPVIGLGLVAMDGCDIFFIDVWLSNTCFCCVVNPGDSEVIEAMEAWDKAGFMRVRITTPDGVRHTMRKEFALNPVLKKAFKDSTEKLNFIDDFRKHFHVLLGPGAIESMVAQRTKRYPEEVRVGFLVTQHTDPGLPEPDRQYH